MIPQNTIPRRRADGSLDIDYYARQAAPARSAERSAALARLVSAIGRMILRPWRRGRPNRF